MSHTPGPWVVKDSHYVIGEQRESSYVEVATVLHSDDARLIAAAPDLLTVLEAAQAVLEHRAPDFDVLNREIRAAIAKARG